MENYFQKEAKKCGEHKTVRKCLKEKTSSLREKEQKCRF